MSEPSPHRFPDLFASGEGVESLRANERRYRALVQATSDFVWVTDAEGQLRTDLPMWRAITGLGREEIQGSGWTRGIHPGDLDRVVAAWRRAVATLEPYRISYRLVGPGGTRWLALDGAPVIDADGAVTEWIGTAVDVTDRRQVQDAQQEMRAALEAERAILADVVARAPVAIAVFSGPEHRYELFNDRYAELVPQGRVEVGLAMAEALPEAGAAIPLMDRALAGETIELSEFSVAFDDARSYEGFRYYEGLYLPIAERAGAPGGVLFIGTEVTEQVRLRESLFSQLVAERELATRLQQALLPDEIPDIAGVQFAVSYVPDSSDVGVGGDWYDVMDLGGGRILVVMGDICGRGLRAAAEMSQVRAALRAYAVQDPRPSAVLGQLARFTTATGLSDMITVGVGLLDAEAQSMMYAGAGHPPPLLQRPGAAPAFLEHAGGGPLGAAETWAETVVPLPAGSFVTLYTDGVVEEHERPLDVTMEELRRASDGPWDSATALCAALVTHALGDRPAQDDVAILVCRT